MLLPVALRIQHVDRVRRQELDQLAHRERRARRKRCRGQTGTDDISLPSFDESPHALTLSDALRAIFVNEPDKQTNLRAGPDCSSEILARQPEAPRVVGLARLRILDRPAVPGDEVVNGRCERRLLVLGGRLVIIPNRPGCEVPGLGR